MHYYSKLSVYDDHYHISEFLIAEYCSSKIFFVLCISSSSRLMFMAKAGSPSVCDSWYNSWEMWWNGPHTLHTQLVFSPHRIAMFGGKPTSSWGRVRLWWLLHFSYEVVSCLDKSSPLLIFLYLPPAILMLLCPFPKNPSSAVSVSLLIFPPVVVSSHLFFRLTHHFSMTY